MLGFAALALLAHLPLLRAGLLPADYAAVLGGGGVMNAWSRVSTALWGLPLPGGAAPGWRLEALLLVLGAACAGRVFLARLLGPWIGEHPARAAAWVSALLLPLHPSSALAVASLAGRGELLALALGLAAAALFLAGRQEEREGWTALSLLLVLGSAWLSSVALDCALVLGASEYLAVRRRRRRSLRVRTTATTLLVFGSASALPWLARAAQGGAGGSAAPTDVRAMLQDLLRELGHLLAPASELLGAPGTLLAGALLLLGLQPAFGGARSAPRLWGALLAGWSAALLVVLASSRGGSVAGSLLATWIVCSGLGLTLTARARPWRASLVIVLAAGWATLAHLGARPWLAGSRELARTCSELRALELPDGAPVLLLDPPRVEGLPSLAHDLGWLAHPRLGGTGSEAAFDPGRLRALSGAAFLAFVPTAEFAELRARGLRVAWRPPGKERLELVSIPPSRGEAAARSWTLEISYDAPADDPLDPLAIEGVRIVAGLSTPVRQLQDLGWRGLGDARGPVSGWLGERAGRRVAEFDLSSSLAWSLAGAVRRLVLENGVNDIERGEVLPRLAELADLGAPRVDGGDWLFAYPSPALAAAGGSHTLTLLALDDLECRQLPLEAEAGALRARDAQRFAERTGGPLAWAVEYRIGAHVLARTRGRVDP